MVDKAQMEVDNPDLHSSARRPEVRRSCRRPGCPETVTTADQGYCDRHQADRSVKLYDHSRADDPLHQIYSTARWQKLREVVKAREPLCRHCQNAATEEADHIIPVKQGGAVWSLDNLQGLCGSCHRSKTRQERTGTAQKGEISGQVVRSEDFTRERSRF